MGWNWITGRVIDLEGRKRYSWVLITPVTYANFMNGILTSTRSGARNKVFWGGVKCCRSGLALVKAWQE